MKFEEKYRMTPLQFLRFCRGDSFIIHSDDGESCFKIIPPTQDGMRYEYDFGLVKEGQITKGSDGNKYIYVQGQFRKIKEEA